MLRLFLCGGAILIAIYSAGCAQSPQYVVNVNGFLDTPAIRQAPPISSICVVDSNNASNPIFEKETAAKIQKLLNQKRFSVGTSEKANYYLLFEYGIDSGRTIVGSSPVYHPGGTSTINTMDNYGGMSYSNVQTPGYTTYKTRSEIIYTRRLVLKLIEGNNYRSSPKAGPLWTGEITSNGSSPDLRDVMNYMLVAAFEHFGENTQKAIREIILSGDARVKALMEP